MFFSVVGPGLITANADNDVGGIFTYSSAGAQFGYSLLWLLVPVTIALVVVQEMCARMGAVTGKGLADLIRENFGVKVTFWCLLLFVLGDVGNTAAEFAGVASSAPILGGYLHIVNGEAFKIALVAGAAIFVFLTVTRGSAKVIERVFFAFCFVYVAYIVSAFAVHPNWGDVLHQSVFPHFTPSKAYLLMIIAIIGTTISPWMQFYIQAAVVDKGVREDDYAYSRLDVVVGGIWTDVIAYFIIVSCAATIFVHNLHAAHPLAINDVGDVAVALTPLAGKFAALLFALGLLNAAVFTASILPLSTAYYVCEAFGFERGVDHRFSE
ncbi:MAG TPA: Nramp family divalent metal transporter, partial [Candidatus Cybelea sp.]|nr:Nramp family divalent metal transporter [Candidatus Cybelea sp.]